MSATVAGTFTGPNQPSGVVDPSSGSGNLRLTTQGCNASNTLKTQKSTNNGVTWADQTTYSSEQTAAVIPTLAGEHWRLVAVAQQQYRDLGYRLSRES